MSILPIIPFRQPLKGNVILPGSKSISNRALLLAALSKGTNCITNLNAGEDTTLLLTALKTLGFQVETNCEAPEIVSIQGTNGSIPNASGTIWVGNAGTVARFLLSFLALHPTGRYILEGDAALCRRPMEPLLKALEAIGARFEFQGLPYHYPFIMTTRGLDGGRLTVRSTESSQFMSALLLLAPFYKGSLKLIIEGSIVSEPFIDLTLKMIQQWGYGSIQKVEDCYLIEKTSALESYHFSGTYAVEPDATAASYFIALCFIVGGSLTLNNFDPTLSIQGDTQFLNYFLNYAYNHHQANRGYTLEVPRSIYPNFNGDFNKISDTFLTAIAISVLSKEPTHIYGVQHVRHQECDRIEAMAEQLKRLGQDVVTTNDSITVIPNRIKLLHLSSLEPVVIDTYNDHRVAMSFSILGSYDLHGTGKPWLAIRNPDSINKTFPCFFKQLEHLHTI